MLSISGSKIKAFRQLLGMEPKHFASLLGVHPSTLYRWEAADKPKVAPLQTELLVCGTIMLDDAVACKKLGADLTYTLISAGRLRALQQLLEALHNENRL